MVRVSQFSFVPVKNSLKEINLTIITHLQHFTFIGRIKWISFFTSFTEFFYWFILIKYHHFRAAPCQSAESSIPVLIKTPSDFPFFFIPFLYFKKQKNLVPSKRTAFQKQFQTDFSNWLTVEPPFSVISPLCKLYLSLPILEILNCDNN